MLLAKESLMAPVDIHELKARGPQNRAEELRLELYEKVNALGIGAQGLGCLTPVVDVKVLDYPTHAANLPVALRSEEHTSALHSLMLISYSFFCLIHKLYIFF